MATSYTVKDGSLFAGKPQAWSQKNLVYLGGNYPYDLAPDGKRFAVGLNAGGAAEQEQNSVDSVRVLLNFFDELRVKVPKAKNCAQSMRRWLWTANRD